MGKGEAEKKRLFAPLLLSCDTAKKKKKRKGEECELVSGVLFVGIKKGEKGSNVNIW